MARARTTITELDAGAYEDGISTGGPGARCCRWPTGWTKESPVSGETAVAPVPRQVAQLLAGLLRDAVGLAQRGTAAPADIDTAMRLGAGHPRGPFEVLASLPAEERELLGLPRPVPITTANATPDVCSPAWTGPVGVAGTGHMASGIVEAVARSRRPVRVLARSAPSGDALLRRLAAGLARAVSRGRLDEAGRDDALDRVSVSEDPTVLSDADVVIEAVAEDLDVKATVLARLDSALPTTVPLATNTSSFRVADLRPYVSPARPVLALHFFNPAQVMKLVEVVVPDDVPGAAELRTTACAWVLALGKVPVTCGDRRGFVVNRLLIPYLNDAVRLHESGLSTAEVDDLMTTGAAHPMGPLALIDLIGLDVTVAALDSMAAVEDDPRIRPTRLLRELAAAGRLGRKTGAGFHTYT
jgi:3-hydroxybutyryl-CoA dehydrogenase